MSNKKRHPDYIKLKHKINACKTLESLENHRQITIRFVAAHKGNDDANDLNLLFLQKRDALNSEFHNQ